MVSLDSDWFILQEFQKTYKARVDNYMDQNDLLQFHGSDVILAKKFRFWNCQPPYVGHVQNKPNVKKRFMRASVDRIYKISNKYPPII